MRKNTKKLNRRKVIAMVLNLMVFCMEAVGMYHTFRNGGIRSLRYYTVLSNILALFVSLMNVISYIRNFKRKENGMPKWLKQLNFVVCNCLAVTFVVVLTILIPMNGIESIDHYLFDSSNKYQHVLCPVFMIFSFCVFEKETKVTKKDNTVAMIPTVAYAVVMMILNLKKILKGPYPFLYVYEQPVYMSVVWSVIILGLNYMLGLALRMLNGMESKGTTRPRKN